LYKMNSIVCAGLMLLALFIGSGCGNSTAKSKANTYSNDGMLGTTNANPNYPTSPTYHNYAADRNMMQTALAKIKGIESSTIRLQGPDAYVNLRLMQPIHIEDEMRIQDEAQDEVSRMVPRYRVHVKIVK
jgi:hypothetical protein